MDDRRARGEGLTGPVQVLLIGIDRPRSEAMLAAELQDLRTQTAIRVIDLLRVHRGLDGELHALSAADPAESSGRLVEALLYEKPGDRASPAPGATSMAASAVGDRWNLAGRIPRGVAVAILLVEHRWAIPLREAAYGLETEIYGDAWIHPRDLESARRAVRPAGH